MDIEANKPLKSIASYVEEYQQGIFLPQKAFTVNFNRKNVCFDDVFLLGTNKEVKVSKIKVLAAKDYVKGIQFTYKIASDNREIDGYNMTTYKGPSVQTKTFELANDEYIIEINGRKGSIIDSIGFKTNKGRVFLAGGNGGGPFSIKCKDGFYFSIFAGSCGDCGDSLSNLTVDILSFPGIIMKKIDFNMSKSKNILRLAMDFLTIRENIDMFLVSRQFSMLRFDHYILGNFWMRLIYTCHNQFRSYIKKIIKTISDEETLKDLTFLTQMLKYTKNKIPNPYGKNEFYGWKTKGNWKVEKGNTQRFRKSCFTTSNQLSSMTFDAELSKLFDSEQISSFRTGLDHIIVGSFFGGAWDKTQASFDCFIYDENDKILFEKHFFKKNCNSLNFEHITFKYKNKGSSPHRIMIRIEGIDNKFWGGHFGPSISGTYIRMLPNDQYFEEYYKETINS